MSGVKRDDMSRSSLIKELSEQIGYVKKTEPELAKSDPTTGTYFCATIKEVPDAMLSDAKAFFESEVVMLRAQAEAAVVPGASAPLNKKASYAHLASQAIEYYAARERGGLNLDEK